MKYYLVIVLVLSVSMTWAQTDPDMLLLRDYKPTSIYKVPVTEIQKAAFPVIDMHSHPYAKSKAQIDRWVETMDAAGIEKTIIMTYAHGDQFDSLISAYSKYPDRFDLWCGFDYTGYDQPGFPENAIRELERCFKAGAKGVGELGDKGKGLFYSKPPAWGMHSDDDRMVPLFSKCAELDLPVNIHIAEPKWMYEDMDQTNDGLMNAYKWRLDNQNDIRSHAEMIEILENTLKKNPETIFIACHLANCCYDLSIVGNLLDNYSNFYIDIGARFGEFSPTPRTSRQFFIRYSDRVVYGTDMGFDLDMYRTTFRILETADEHFYDHERFSYHWPLHGLDLPEEVLRKVYFENASALIRQ